MSTRPRPTGRPGHMAPGSHGLSLPAPLSSGRHTPPPRPRRASQRSTVSGSGHPGESLAQVFGRGPIPWDSSPSRPEVSPRPAWGRSWRPPPRAWSGPRTATRSSTSRTGLIARGRGPMTQVLDEQVWVGPFRAFSTGVGRDGDHYEWSITIPDKGIPSRPATSRGPESGPHLPPG
jgi:hypothetical protein